MMLFLLLSVYICLYDLYIRILIQAADLRLRIANTN